MAEPLNAARIAEIVTGRLSGQEDVVAVFLFGPVAEGTDHALSDVDLAVLFRHDLPADAVSRRTLELGTLVRRLW